MIHGLAGIPPDVEDETVAALGDALLSRHRVGGLEKVAEHAVLSDVAGVGQMPARHHQHVDRRPRRHVFEGEDPVILEQNTRRRPAGGYLAEDAMWHLSSTLEPYS
jgi:hypothetical protein